jgi:hypothetical protein
MKRASAYCYTQGKVLKQRYPAVSVEVILTETATASFPIPELIHAGTVRVLKIN